MSGASREPEGRGPWMGRVISPGAPIFEESPLPLRIHWSWQENVRTTRVAGYADRVTTIVRGRARTSAALSPARGANHQWRKLTRGGVRLKTTCHFFFHQAIELCEHSVFNQNNPVDSGMVQDFSLQPYGS